MMGFKPDTEDSTEIRRHLRTEFFFFFFSFYIILIPLYIYLLHSDSASFPFLLFPVELPDILA